MTDIKLGNYEIKSGQELPSRFSALLWGEAGDGKTTLAATAPGKKLWINFDPDGPRSIIGLADQHKDNRDSILRIPILVADLSGETSKVVDGFRNEDHLKLGAILSDVDIGIETVVVDSVTRFSQLAMELAVKNNIGGGSNFRPSLETPGQTAYGARNTLTYRMFVDIFTVTKKYNKNVIFITHEAAPHTNDKGETLFITMALGGQLPRLGSSQLSEVWHVSDTGRERRIAVRPCRSRKPMKSRMWDITGSPEFVWKYNIENPDPEFEIATWWRRYLEGGGRKLPLPK